MNYKYKHYFNVQESLHFSVSLSCWKMVFNAARYSSLTWKVVPKRRWTLLWPYFILRLSFCKQVMFSNSQKFTSTPAGSMHLEKSELQLYFPVDRDCNCFFTEATINQIMLSFIKHKGILYKIVLFLWLTLVQIIYHAKEFLFSESAWCLWSEPTCLIGWYLSLTRLKTHLRLMMIFTHHHQVSLGYYSRRNQ